MIMMWYTSWLHGRPRTIDYRRLKTLDSSCFGRDTQAPQGHASLELAACAQVSIDELLGIRGDFVFLLTTVPGEVYSVARVCSVCLPGTNYCCTRAVPGRYCFCFP